MDTPSSLAGIRAEVNRRFAAALDAVLPSFRELAETAERTWNIRAPVVLLTSLHLLAAAGGCLFRLRDRGIAVTSPFNVIFCGDGKCRQRFVEYLAEPWLGEVRKLLETFQNDGRTDLSRRVARAKKAVAYPSMREDPDSTESPHEHYLKLAAALQPHLVVHSPLPKMLRRGLLHSYDRAVLSLDGGTDPAEELLRGGKLQVFQMGSLLGASWAGLDLPEADRMGRPGVVHVLWQTHADAARRLILDPASPWQSDFPPVLLAWQPRNPAFLADLPGKAFERWSDYLKGFYANRHRPAAGVDWELPPGIKRIWAQFHQECTHLVKDFQPFPPWMFAWMPELMLRLTMVFAAVESLVPDGDGALRTPRDDHALRACTVARWLLYEHYHCLKSLMGSSQTEDADGIGSGRADAAEGGIHGAAPAL
jgi:hypothetical protein